MSDKDVEIAFSRRSNIIKAEHYEDLIRAHEQGLERLQTTLKLVGEDTEQWKDYMDLNNRYKQSLERLRDHYLEQDEKERKADLFHTVTLWFMGIGLIATFVGQAIYANVKAEEIKAAPVELTTKK